MSFLTNHIYCGKIIPAASHIATTTKVKIFGVIKFATEYKWFETTYTNLPTFSDSKS